MVPSATDLTALGTIGYLLVLCLLFPFGLHRLYLVWLRLRAGDVPDVGVASSDRGSTRPSSSGRGSGGDGTGPNDASGGWPVVTVQIPVYDEANVVARAIDAACRLRYPRDRLEVQVLDDSTDRTTEIAARRVAAWRERGVDARHVRRGTREGYKAGALAEGVRRARGEYFLVLDADFVPGPDLVRRLLPSFSDPKVGFVQAAWSHLDRDESWLSRGQALLLDGHFAVEHAARHRSDLFFNFNGTAGMWRRACLEDVGGWSGETLTEDLELSYRAQLAGWRGVYRDDVRVPGELPGTLRALEVQQSRWARGGMQTARRVLPRLWRSDRRPAVKLEATAHLAGHLLHPLTVLLGIALAWPGRLGGAAALVPGWVHAGAVAFAVLPFLAHYGVAARLRGHGLLESVPRIAEAVVLGIGLGPPLAAAVWRGLTGPGGGVFRRTPKRGSGAGADRDGTGRPDGGDGGVGRSGPETEAEGYRVPFRPVRTLVRGGLGLALVVAAGRLLAAGAGIAALFTALFAVGYLATAAAGVRDDGAVDGPGRLAARRPLTAAVRAATSARGGSGRDPRRAPGGRGTGRG